MELKFSNNKFFNVLIFCAVFSLFLLLLHLFLGRAVIKHANSVKKELFAKQQTLQDEEVLIKSLPNPQKAMEELEKKFQDFQDVGVSKKQIPKIIQSLGMLTDKYKINLISIKPREDLKSMRDNLPAGVSKIYIELEVKCPYKVFGEYIKTLVDLSPGFTVESISMEKPVASAAVPISKTPGKPEGKQEVPAQDIFIKFVVSTYTVWEI
ncbi:MAG: type 4a pilus biogenesis protein PilO [Candidatus Omnitrophica bacterium]|nr:type 4a pilus biogenesis protein PilO [Candidatus Omnitrophota bacterium]